MMQQKDYLIGHMEDLADKAVKMGCAASRFLTPVIFKIERTDERVEQ